MAADHKPFTGRREIPRTEVRFVPREHRLSPRTTEWEVYDKATGSVGNVRFGTNVKMVHLTKAEAQAECDRLEALRG